MLEGCGLVPLQPQTSGNAMVVVLVGDEDGI